jgi:tetratricopeptide (TPR) repeat protein
MRKANLILAAAMAALGVAGVTTALLAPTTVEAQAQQKIGSKMAKPLRAAQEAVGAKDWNGALQSLAEARAIEPKTPYEAFMVDELSWYAYVQTQDFAAAQQALGRAVSSGFVPEENLPQRYKALAQISYQIQDYPGAIEYGNKYLATSPDSQDVAALVAQSLYVQKDYAGSRAVVERTAASVAKPDEQLLQIGLRSAYEMDDRPATLRSLESLIRFYPATKYWEDLLNNQLYETKTERDLRILYRLIIDTQTMDRPEEYAEAASVLMTGGFPTEAKQVLEKAIAAGVFKGDSLTRAQDDLARARTAADADRKELPGADQAVATAKSGNEMVAMGKLFFSVGQYDKAADAIQKGLAKGGVSDVDDANALLGIAQVRAGKGAEAVAAFDAVKDPKLVEVTRYWKLFVAAEAAPASEPASG